MHKATCKHVTWPLDVEKIKVWPPFMEMWDNPAIIQCKINELKVSDNASMLMGAEDNSTVLDLLISRDLR